MTRTVNDRCLDGVAVRLREDGLSEEVRVAHLQHHQAIDRSQPLALGLLRGQACDGQDALVEVPRDRRVISTCVHCRCLFQAGLWAFLAPEDIRVFVHKGGERSPQLLARDRT